MTGEPIAPGAVIENWSVAQSPVAPPCLRFWVAVPVSVTCDAKTFVVKSYLKSKNNVSTVTAMLQSNAPSFYLILHMFVEQGQIS